ncbi:MAG: hypothetical protein Q7R96_00880 [Nanoarchaeota archaeon]|nr:hypothetical protein [Nanoarchaeota archaeon]
MRYFDAIWAFGVVFVIVAILNYVIPNIDVDINVELIITISTFLFAILAGFFTSRLNNRYDKIRELVATEDASLFSLYHASKIYGKKFSDDIRELIDKYYITCYDNPVSGAYAQTVHYVIKFWDKLQEISKHKSESLYQVLCQNLVDLERSRKESSATYIERLGVGQWFVLIFLGVIVVAGLFLIRTGTVTSDLVTILLTSAIMLVLLIIRDLNNFMLGGIPLMEESGQTVLEAIGKERYYHDYFIKKGFSQGHKKSHVQRYRLGTHELNSGKHSITLVKK